MQNHSKLCSIVLIFQYVVYEDFSDLMQKFRKNPCMAKWIFEALNNTLFYELFIVKNGGIYFVEVKVGRFLRQISHRIQCIVVIQHLD